MYMYAIGAAATGRDSIFTLAGSATAPPGPYAIGTESKINHVTVGSRREVAIASAGGRALLTAPTGRYAILARRRPDGTVIFSR